TPRGSGRSATPCSWCTPRRARRCAFGPGALGCRAMAWWSRKNKATEQRQHTEASKRSMSEGLFQKCSACHALLDSSKVLEALRCCPDCGFHFTLPTEERIGLMLDEGSFREEDAAVEPADPLGFRDSKAYADRLRATREAVGAADAFR